MSFRSTPLLRRMLLAAPLITIASLVPVTAQAASGLNPLPPAGVSPNGQNIYNLYLFISIPALAVFFLIEGLLLTIIIRDRRKRRGPDYQPPQWHSHRGLEITWTVIPFLILVAIGTASFLVLQQDFQRPTDAQTDMEVDVSAHQFGWTYAYPQQGFAVTSEGQQAASDPLVVPTGKLVRIKLDSQDVIHSFWVPDITGKTDAVPGYDNYTWFKISEPGQWRGECAELCGQGHYTMQIMVKAVTPDDFDTWAAQQKAKSAPRAASPSPSASPAASASPSPSPSAPASPSPSPSASPSPSPSPSR